MKKSNKKSFKGGMSSLLSETATKKKIGRPITSTGTKKVSKESERGTKVGETRATFIVSSDLLDKLKCVAWFERLSIKKALNLAVSDYFKKVGESKVNEAVKKYKEAH